jgi:hypothetical protein
MVTGVLGVDTEAAPDPAARAHKHAVGHAITRPHLTEGRIVLDPPPVQEAVTPIHALVSKVTQNQLYFQLQEKS